MNLFYCLSCEQIHEIKPDKDEVFKTAFRAISEAQTHVPLGYCVESKHTTDAITPLLQG